MVDENNLGVLNRAQQSNNSNVKTSNSNSKNNVWLKIGFGCGIILSILSLIFFINLFSDFLNGFNIDNSLGMILFVSVTIITCFFYFAFFKLGKYVNSKTLKVSSLILIVFAIIIGILVIALNLWVQSQINEFTQMSGIMTGNVVADDDFSSLYTTGSTGLDNSMDFDDFDSDDFGDIFANAESPWETLSFRDKSLLIGGFIFFFLLFLTQLIFGIGLIGIRNQVKFSMTGGVFRVITSAGLLIGEIFFVYFFMKIMLNPEFIFELLIKAMQDPDSLKAWIFLIKWSPRVIGLLGLMSMIFETVVLFFSVKKFG